jgi:alginate O-acetyltransferase complex protein AlgI
MAFTTHIFIFYFLPLFLLVYLCLPGRWRNLWITTASYVFYGWCEPWFALLLLSVTAVNYGCGRLISQPGAGERQRFWGCALAVLLSLGILGYFKYLMFFEANLNHALAWLGASQLRVLRVLLPMGISFYIFKALSYNFDLYRGTVQPARTGLDFACYLALFPQLGAGPIDRFGSLAGRLADRPLSLAQFAAGVALFILGFAKKVLLADPAGEIATAAFNAQSLLALDAWYGALAYAFQIYFDFSGYSDMAVGLGRMLGFEFMKNFNSPYHAESITDFWRRWHISLSSWFRDYVFLPLELATRDSPHPARRVSVNLLGTMLLIGLWHGASWTFVAWGACHGTALALETWGGRKSRYQRLPRPLRVGMTLLLVLFSWVLFRSGSFQEAGRYWAAMCGAAETSPTALLLAAQLYTPGKLLLMGLCAVLVIWPVQAHEWSVRITWGKALLLGLAFCLALTAMSVRSFQPFLYFRF